MITVQNKTAIIIILALSLITIFMILNQPITTKDVRQYIDHDARIVCYILENGNGISCLPIDEVNLDE